MVELSGGGVFRKAAIAHEAADGGEAFLCLQALLQGLCHIVVVGPQHGGVGFAYIGTTTKECGKNDFPECTEKTFIPH